MSNIKKWEYKTLELSTDDIDKLNTEGKEGWMIACKIREYNVTSISTNNESYCEDIIVYLLQRPYYDK